MRSKTKTMKLPTDMSDEDFVAKSHELIDILSRLQHHRDMIANMQADLSSYKSENKEEIQRLENESGYLAKSMQRRHIVKDVEVYEVFDEKNGIAFFRRCDNDALVPGKFRHIEAGEQIEADFSGQEPHAVALSNDELTAFRDMIFEIISKAQSGNAQTTNDILLARQAIPLLASKKAITADEARNILEADYLDIDQEGVSNDAQGQEETTADEPISGLDANNDAPGIEESPCEETQESAA